MGWLDSPPFPEAISGPSLFGLPPCHSRGGGAALPPARPPAAGLGYLDLLGRGVRRQPSPAASTWRQWWGDPRRGAASAWRGVNDPARPGPGCHGLSTSAFPLSVRLQLRPRLADCRRSAGPRGPLRPGPVPPGATPSSAGCRGCHGGFFPRPLRHWGAWRFSLPLLTTPCIRDDGYGVPRRGRDALSAMPSYTRRRTRPTWHDRLDDPMHARLTRWRNDSRTTAGQRTAPDNDARDEGGHAWPGTPLHRRPGHTPGSARRGLPAPSLAAPPSRCKMRAWAAIYRRDGPPASGGGRALLQQLQFTPPSFLRSCGAFVSPRSRCNPLLRGASWPHTQNRTSWDPGPRSTATRPPGTRALLQPLQFTPTSPSCGAAAPSSPRSCYPQHMGLHGCPRQPASLAFGLTRPQDKQASPEMRGRSYLIPCCADVSIAA